MDAISRTMCESARIWALGACTQPGASCGHRRTQEQFAVAVGTVLLTTTGATHAAAACVSELNSS